MITALSRPKVLISSEARPAFRGPGKRGIGFSPADVRRDSPGRIDRRYVV